MSLFAQSQPPLNPPAVARALKWLLRSPLRGRTRLTLFLAGKMRSLQCFPMTTTDGARLYLDLRVGSAHALLAGLPWEVAEQNVMRAIVRPGDVAVDIGAHLGAHATLLSQLVGPTGAVHAFEPNTELLAVLSRTLARLGNATLHSVALSDEEDTADLYVPRDISMASLANWCDESRFVRKVTCRKRTLDALVGLCGLPQPDFIKCDVEGGEAQVFAGGRWVLDRADAPIILFEVNPQAAQAFGSGIHQLTDLLQSFSAAQYEIIELPVDQVTQLGGRGSSYSRNCLAVPLSRRCRLDAFPAMPLKASTVSHTL